MSCKAAVGTCQHAAGQVKRCHTCCSFVRPHQGPMLPSPYPTRRFHQMAGRAGRPGMASLGQAFLLAGKEQPPDAYLQDLLHSKPGEERAAPVLRDCSEEGACG